MKKKEMQFKQLNIFFIYPFALPALDLLKAWSNLSEFNQIQSPDSSRPEYLPPYIKLRSDEIRFCPLKEQVTCELKLPSNLNKEFAPYSAALRAEIILKRAGSACCVFEVEVMSHDQTHFDVNSVLDFTLIEDYSSTIKLHNLPLDKVFFEEKEWEGELFRLYELMVNGTTSKLYTGDQENKWQESRGLFSAGEFQHPYIMTVAQLAEGTPYDYIIKKSQGRSKNVLDCASMLVRTYVSSKQGADAIDETYLRHTTEVNDGLIANLYPFQHLFTSIHYRSCLTIHGEYSQDELKYYGTQYIQQLKESVVNARCQWFILLLLNAKLDDLLAYSALNLAPGLIAGELTGEEDCELHGLLQKIIKLRTNTSLALNDPVSYGHAAGSFSHLFRRMLGLFRINELEASLQVKLQALDRMYDDLRELHRLSLMKRDRISL